MLLLLFLLSIILNYTLKEISRIIFTTIATDRELIINVIQIYNLDRKSNKRYKLCNYVLRSIRKIKNLKFRNERVLWYF